MTVKATKRFFLRNNSEAHQQVVDAVRELREMFEQFKAAPRANSPEAEELYGLVASGLVRTMVDDYNMLQKLEYEFYDNCATFHFAVSKAQRKQLRGERHAVAKVLLSLLQRGAAGDVEHDEVVEIIESHAQAMIDKLRAYVAVLARLKSAVSAYIDSPACSEAIRAHGLIAKFRIGTAEEGETGEPVDAEERVADLAFVASGKAAAKAARGKAEATVDETLAQLDFVSACNTFGVDDACEYHEIDAKAVRAAVDARAAALLLRGALPTLKGADLRRMQAAPAYQLFGKNARMACDLPFVDAVNALGPATSCELFGISAARMHELAKADDTDALCAAIGRNVTVYHLRALNDEHARTLFGDEHAAKIVGTGARGTSRALRRRKDNQRAYIAAMAAHLSGDSESEDDGLPKGARVRDERDRRGYDGQEASESEDRSFAADEDDDEDDDDSRSRASSTDDDSDSESEVDDSEESVPAKRQRTSEENEGLFV